MEGDEDDMPTLVKIKQPTMNAFAEFLKQPPTTKPDDSLVLGAARDAGFLLVRHLVEERNGDVQCRGPRGETLLHMAAEGGDVELLEYLYTMETPLHDKDSDHATPLHYAGRQGNTDAVRFLLERGLELDAVDGHGETCLQIATRRGHYDVMGLLVDKGAKYEVCPDIELTEEQLEVCLLCAAFSGNVDSVRHLIELRTSVNIEHAKRVDLNSKDDKGRTGMWIASAKGHLDIVKLLYENGASMVGDKEDSTPLHEAAREGKAEVVSFLLQHGVDINVVNDRGQTALVLASFLGHLDIVKKLIENKASMVGDIDGFSPIHMAAQEGKVEVVSFLAQHVENINVVINSGQTALSLACSNGRLDVVKLLVQNGATIVGDEDGDTPFHLAAWAGEVEVISFLVKHVDDINLVNRNDQNALSISSFLGHLDVVKVLVQSGAKAVSDSIWFSPIHVAAEEGKVEVVSILVQHINDINVVDKKGLSALALALGKGQLDVVKVLLEKGATLVGDKIDPLLIHKAARDGNVKVVSFLLQQLVNINIVNKFGQTALGMASLNNHFDVVKLLVENGATMLRDSEGNSPLFLAAAKGHIEVVSFLIQHVEDVNIVNNNGQTALNIASFLGQLEVVKLLLKNKATMVSDKVGDLPIHAAAEGGKVEVVSYLLQRVEDINAKNNNDVTALCKASFIGHLNVVKLLVEHGATMVVDKDGDSPLHLAAREGKAEVVSFLLQHVGDINLVNKNGQTALILACLECRLNVLKVLVQARASMISDKNGYSPLHAAAQGGNLEVVTYLIQHFEDINLQNNFGQTALMCASNLGFLGIVKVLVEKGASMISDHKGDSPLHAAALGGNVEVVSYLIQHVDDINLHNGSGPSVLVYAALSGSLDVVKLLVEQGASMVGGKDGFTPLIQAAANGSIEMVAYLIQRVEDINEVNNTGQTALALASLLGHLEVVKLLVESGATMVGEEDGDSPLHLAAEGGMVDVVSFLLQHGVDINLVNKNGQTALFMACLKGRLNVLKVLVEARASMICDTNGFSPLHAAAQGGNVEVVSFLLQHFKDINLQNNFGRTALVSASFSGFLDIVKVLVENGASMISNNGRLSPFHAAAHNGKLEVVAYLIQHVEDINEVDNNGHTALALASRLGHLDVVKLLVESGATMVGDEDGDSLLHLAAEGGKVEVVTYLMQHFEDINLQNNSGETALALASFTGSLDIVKVLLENGASMISDNEGVSPLHVAAAKGYIEVVPFLLHHVKDINEVNNNGQTALALASLLGHLDVVKLLVESGATMVGDNDDYSPLHLAAARGNFEVSSFLIQHDVNINLVNKIGLTALSLASLNGYLDVVKLLVENQATMVGDINGNPPFHLAAAKGHIEVASFLIQHVDDINAVNKIDQTALLSASLFGHLDVVKLLVQNGAIMVGDKNGDTPFHIAAMEGKVDVVSFLLQHVENVNEVNNKGVSALAYALANGQFEVVKLLLENGARMYGDEDGDTPLHLAASVGNIDVVALLLQYVQDVNEVNHKGETAVLVALMSGHLDVVDLLVASGGSMAG